MSEALHPNVVRVVEAARALGLEITPRRFPDGTKTAADAAAAAEQAAPILGVPVCRRAPPTKGRARSYWEFPGDQWGLLRITLDSLGIPRDS